MNKEDLQLITNETFIQIMKHQRKQVESFRKICVASFITLCVTVAIVCFCVLYFLNAYTIEVEDTVTTTYEQSSDGESQIINGDNYNDGAVHNDNKE